MTQSTSGPFRRRLVRNTAWTSLNSLWAVAVGVVTLPLTLRGLGADAFGLWVLLNTFSVTSGWYSVADAGVGTAAVREIAARESRGDVGGSAAMVSSCTALFLALGVAFAASFLLIGFAVPLGVIHVPVRLRHDMHVAVVIFAVQLLVDQASCGTQSTLEGLQRVELSKLVDFFRRTSSAIAVAAVAMSNGGLVGVAVASLGGSVVGVVAAAVVLHRVRPRWTRVRPSLAEMRATVSSARMIAVMQPLSVVHRQMDRLVVGVVFGPTGVSVVEVATQLSTGVDAILIASTYAVTPAASWVAARRDHEALRELLLRGSKYAVLVTMPFVLGGMLLSGSLVRLWVGPSQAAAVGPVALALAYVAMSAPVKVSQAILVGIRQERVVLVAALGAVLINLAGSIVLVHVLGVPGVFVATLLGGVFLVPFLLGPTLREVGVGLGRFLRESVWPVVPPGGALAVAVGAVVLSPLGDWATLGIGVAAGGLAYLAVSWRWSVDRSELADLGRSLAPSGRAAGA